MSTSLARPCGVTMMFDGLMSRWTTPRSAAWTRALAICRVKLIASLDRQRAVALDPLADRRPFDIFKGDEVIPAVEADRVDPGDVLVVEPGRGAAFLVVALDDLGVDRLIGREDLERDLAVELDVDGPEDRPHPAGADRLLQAEDVDPVARHGQRRDVRSRGGGAAIRRPTRGQGRTRNRRRARRSRRPDRGRVGTLDALPQVRGSWDTPRGRMARGRAGVIDDSRSGIKEFALAEGEVETSGGDSPLLHLRSKPIGDAKRIGACNRVEPSRTIVARPGAVNYHYSP